VRRLGAQGSTVMRLEEALQGFEREARAPDLARRLGA
jgi:hypothetical protein